jgi:hypothetical protein
MQVGILMLDSSHGQTYHDLLLLVHLLDGAKLPNYWHNGEPGNCPAVWVAKDWIAQEWLSGDTLQGRYGLTRTAAGNDAWGAWANAACARPLA